MPSLQGGCVLCSVAPGSPVGCLWALELCRGVAPKIAMRLRINQAHPNGVFQFKSPGATNGRPWGEGNAKHSGLKARPNGRCARNIIYVQTFNQNSVTQPQRLRKLNAIKSLSLSAKRLS